jgi:hypothetical protein
MHDERTTHTFNSLSEFYPYYLSQHRHPICRILHVIGSTLALALIPAAFITGIYWLILLPVPVGYSFAWLGHFGFEGNKPATFGYPRYSFMSDWIMWKDVLTGRLPLFSRLPDDGLHDELPSST